MNSEVYVKKNNGYEKDSSVNSFVVPQGSYKYTVNLNKSQNQFDITHATLKDTLSSDIMHYVGYVKITAYEYDESSNTYKDKIMFCTVLVFLPIYDTIRIAYLSNHKYA